MNLSSFLLAAAFAGVFSDNAVLQRDRPVAVWGTAQKGERVTVSFAGAARTATADGAGRWRVELPPMAASREGRDLTLAAASGGQTVRNVLVGEVWFVGGQSNAVCPFWTDRGVHFRDWQGGTLVQYMDLPLVRFSNDGKTWKPFAPAVLAGHGAVTGGDRASFSALGVYFARELFLALGCGVPVGVIGVYFNGTGIDTWIPAEGYRTRDDLDDMKNWRRPKEWTDACTVGPIVAEHQQPSFLFDALVRPWTPWTIRGVVWNQGDSNIVDAPRYAAKMHALWNGWSKVFGNDTLPFLFAEQCHVDGTSAEVVKSQLAFAAENPHAGIAASNDIVYEDLHAMRKEPLARRFVLQALRRCYGRTDVASESPLPVSVRAKGDTLTVEFSNARTLYVFSDITQDVSCDLELAGTDGKWAPAEILNFTGAEKGGWASDGHISEPRLVLRAKGVAEPKRVRYLGRRPIKGNLYNEAALPAFPFELDVTSPEELFAAPPAEAHVGVWWHWMGGQVTEEGIRRDLAWFRRVGVTCATVFGMADSCTPWAKRIGGVPGGIRPYDERWWKLFAFACREGKRLGIDIGLHNCPGYTSTGGPWIRSQLAMRELVFNVTNAAEQISLTPRAPSPVYDEVNKVYGRPDLPERRTDVVEIGVARGGIRVAHIPLGPYVQPTDWDSRGLECDKMNPDAVKFHLDHVIGEWKRHLGADLPAAGLRHILLDSYEAGDPSWTPRMREEFTARRGYDPLEFLPILGGYTNLYTTAEIARFRADFDRTVKDLYRDVLFKIMHERLAAEGLKFACEPYVGPFDPREVATHIDRLMTEVWYGPRGAKLFDGSPEHLLFNTYVGPGVKRHNVIEAEAFTGQPQQCRWTEMPATLKPTMDDAYLLGVNRLILHSNVLQPWGDDVKPGVTMGRWGVHFGRNQTWAETGRAWYDYAARCQALLQWGRPSAERLGTPLRQTARTDGKRTIWFVANRGDRAVPFGLNGRWFDPLDGRVGAVPRDLEPGRSGFYERGAAAPDARRFVRPVALGSFTPALGDWTKTAERRYFSGTLTYRISFDCEASADLELALGDGLDQVFNVRVNGRDAGTLWCPPWKIILPAALVKKGTNTLEIDVTNAWHNRLAGDEREPSDCSFERAPMVGGQVLVRYPDWFARGLGARPSKGRKCFVTWNYFDATEPLVPAGLIGPVTLKSVDAGTHGANKLEKRMTTDRRAAIPAMKAICEKHLK